MEKKQSEDAEIQSKAAEAKAKDPNEKPLIIAFGVFDKKTAEGKKVGQLRELCRERGLKLLV